MKTMKNIAKIFGVILLMLVFKSSYGQQQIMYSQYMINPMVINPAYAGSQESISLTGLIREQWVGLDGAPSTQTFTGHMPFERKRIGVGLSLLHDKIGITDQTGLFAAYAYKIPMSEKGVLSLGIQGGFIHYKARYSEVSDYDPTFQTGDVSEYHPNFGFGVYYSTDRFYAGFAVPQLIQNKMDRNNPNSDSRLVRHYFFHSGYVIDLNPSLKLKPNALLKIVGGAPIELDLNANLYIKELLGVGLSWRSFESIIMILQVQATKNLNFGYSYDFGTTALRQVSAGSHEFSLNYRFTTHKSKIITPRYF